MLARAGPQTAEAVMNAYVGTYANFSYVIVAIGVLVILLNKPFDKLLHGVK